MITATFLNSRVLTLAALLAATLFSVSLGSARASELPSGFSVVDQYTEAFPGVRGDKEPPSGNRNNADNFPGKTVDRFTKEGASGEAALKLAAAGAPESAPVNMAANDRSKNGQVESGTAVGNRPDSDVSLAAPPVDASQQVAKQVFGVAGSDGMGIFLPLILVLAALLAGFYVVRSKRSPI